MNTCRYDGYKLGYDFFCSVLPSSSTGVITADSPH